MRKLILFTVPTAVIVAAAIFVFFNAPLTIHAQETDSLGGHIDSFFHVQNADQWIVQGWAYNPADPDSDVEVELWIDGALAKTIEPITMRGDVSNFIGVDRKTGFMFVVENESFTCKWKEGVDSCRDYHEMNFVVRDINSGNVFSMGGGEFEIDRNDIGVVGTIESASYLADDGRVSVVGWATGLLESPHEILIIANDKAVWVGEQTQERNDVEEAYRMPGRKEGLNTNFAIEPGLSYVRLQIYAIDLALGTATKIDDVEAEIR